MALKAVGFDLDGTLYPGWALYIRSIDLGLRNARLLAAYGKARLTLREGSVAAGSLERFRLSQAEMVAALLGNGTGAEYVPVLERLIYRQIENRFVSIKPFKGVANCLEALRAHGLRLGLLSDLPPWRKLEFLGLDKFFDVIHCSEDAGALKPHPASFLKLAAALGVQTSEMAYVGNKREYDIVGAGNLGMKTALRTRTPHNEADFLSFSNWKKLEDWLLSMR